MAHIVDIFHIYGLNDYVGGMLAIGDSTPLLLASSEIYYGFREKLWTMGGDFSYYFCHCNLTNHQ